MYDALPSASPRRALCTASNASYDKIRDRGFAHLLGGEVKLYEDGTVSHVHVMHSEKGFVVSLKQNPTATAARRRADESRIDECWMASGPDENWLSVAVGRRTGPFLDVAPGIEGLRYAIPRDTGWGKLLHRDPRRGEDDDERRT